MDVIQIKLEQPELAIVSMQAMWALSVSAHQRANLVDVGSAEMLVQVCHTPRNTLSDSGHPHPQPLVCRWSPHSTPRQKTETTHERGGAFVTRQNAATLAPYDSSRDTMARR